MVLSLALLTISSLALTICWLFGVSWTPGTSYLYFLSTGGTSQILNYVSMVHSWTFWTWRLFLYCMVWKLLRLAFMSTIGLILSFLYTFSVVSTPVNFVWWMATSSFWFAWSLTYSTCSFFWQVKWPLVAACVASAVVYNLRRSSQSLPIIDRGYSRSNTLSWCPRRKREAKLI